MTLPIAGLVVQTYEEVLNSIITSEQELVSKQINVDDNTSLGETNKIMAAEMASLNALLQDIYDSRDIYKAEGKSLDDAVSWLGLVRQQAASTNGTQFFKGFDGITITAGSLVQNDSTKETYGINAALTLTSSACYDATIKIPTYADAVTYTVTVDGDLYSYISTGGDDANAVFTNLASQITTAATGTYTASVDTVNERLVIVSTSFTNFFVVTTSQDMSVDEVTNSGLVTGTNTGPLAATANSVINILSPANGWNETYNPEQLVIGRDLETDVELRLRAVNFKASTGTATIESLVANLLNLTGVASANINERWVSLGTADWDVGVTVADSTIFAMTINGDAYNYTSGGAATENEIIQGLVNAINIGGSRDYSASVFNDGSNDFVRVTAPNLYTILIIDTGAGVLSLHDGQPAGSIQAVVSGGDADAIAQAIWDSKPAGVQVWATGEYIVGSTYTTGNAVSQATSEVIIVPFNRPTQIPITVNVKYQIFDPLAFPVDQAAAELAMKEAVVTFGNALNAGEAVVSDEFEASVYCSTTGIYKLIIEMSGNGVSMAESVIIPIASDEEAYFDVASVTAIDETP